MFIFLQFLLFLLFREWPKIFFPFKILKNIFTHFRVFSIFQDFSNDLEAVFDLFIDLNIGSLFYPFLLIDHSFSINRTKHSLNFQLCYSKNKFRSFFERKQKFFILFLEQKIEKGFEKASIFQIEAFFPRFCQKKV